MAPTLRSRETKPAATRRATNTPIPSSRTASPKQPRTPKHTKTRTSASSPSFSQINQNAKTPTTTEPKRSFQKLTGFSPGVNGTYIGRFHSHSPDKPVFHPGTRTTTPLPTTYVPAPQRRPSSGTPLTSMFNPITASPRGASLPSTTRATAGSCDWTPPMPPGSQTRTPGPRGPGQGGASGAPFRATAARRQSTHRGNPTIDPNSHLSGILYAVYREVHDVRTFLDCEVYHPAFDPVIEALDPALEAIYDADQEVIARSGSGQ